MTGRRDRLRPSATAVASSHRTTGGSVQVGQVERIGAAGAVVDGAMSSIKTTHVCDVSSFFAGRKRIKHIYSVHEALFMNW